MDYRGLKSNSVFIEAGSFDDFGGWVLDTQFVEAMGSAFLLAHGLGKPVRDAVKRVTFPAEGTYRAFALTRDWVAPWKRGAAPGLFEIRVGDKKLGRVFGNEGAEWRWQFGGPIDINSRETVVALNDLTGFEGRVAALFFTMDENFSPPYEKAELENFRRQLTGNENERDLGDFDIVIAGGGISGICAALSSARGGLKTALVQDRPVVGGNNSGEVRVWLGGEIMLEPFKNIGSIVAELEQKKTAHYGPDNTADIYEDERKLSLLLNEPNATLFLEHAVVGASVENDLVKSAALLDLKSGERKRISARLFVDATGDGTLGHYCGADYETATNGHMGMTNVWNVRDTGCKTEFPKCPWAIDLGAADFPGRNESSAQNGDWYGERTGPHAFGGWYWESGFEHDPIHMAEYARDTNFRAMYGAWDAVKNVDKSYENYEIGDCCYIAGKRESRRLIGDVFLTKSDVLKSRAFDDGCVPSTWTLDVHYPDRRYYAAFAEGDAFIMRDYHEHFKKPYFIPYRCMYSRNVGNLFMAGRNVSVTHEALGTVRVMRTCGMMGEAVGIAAAICKKRGALPRDVYEKYLDEFITNCKR